MHRTSYTDWQRHCNTKHIPLHDKYVIRDRRKLILIAHFRYLTYENCHFRL